MVPCLYFIHGDINLTGGYFGTDFVGVGAGGGLRVIVLSTAVMVNRVASALTTCIADVSRCSAVKVFCLAVFGDNGIVASSTVPAAGVERLVGSKARVRLIIPVILASLIAVFLMTRVRGDELVDTSRIILTSLGLKTILTVVNTTGLSAVSHTWKLVLGGITAEVGWMEILTVLVPAFVGSPCGCNVARVIANPIRKNRMVATYIPWFFVRWSARRSFWYHGMGLARRITFLSSSETSDDSVYACCWVFALGAIVFQPE